MVELLEMVAEFWRELQAGFAPAPPLDPPTEPRRSWRLIDVEAELQRRAAQ